MCTSKTLPAASEKDPVLPGNINRDHIRNVFKTPSITESGVNHFCHYGGTLIHVTEGVMSDMTLQLMGFK